MFSSLLKTLQPVIRIISQHQGSAFLVGGCVRDQFLNLSSKDLDIEVYGFDTLKNLHQALSSLGKTNLVGQSYGVLKCNFQGLDIDFSLPRKDTKIGPGHTGFSIETNSHLTFKEAASRRDFTINAIGVNLVTGEVEDPYNGIEDIRLKRLHPVSPAFIEDPLRVLRAVQFAARFDFELSQKTIQYCQNLPLHELPKERIFIEFEKLLLKSTKPSKGLDLLSTCDALKLFPELAALKDVPQDPEWHPEGDVWTHTLMVVDEMARLKPEDPEKAIIFMLAALCHDFGKATTTVFKEGRWRSWGHDKEGVDSAYSFLKRLTDQKKLIDAVLVLVRHHMKPALLYKDTTLHRVKNTAIKRLSLKVDIPELVLLAKADHFGRGLSPNKPLRFPAGEWLINRYKQLDLHQQKPVPFLRGDQLLKLGMKPGPKLGKLLKKSFDLQLSGDIETPAEALEWVKKHLDRT